MDRTGFAPVPDELTVKRIDEVMQKHLAGYMGIISHDKWADLRFEIGHYFAQQKKYIVPEIVCLCGSTRFMDAFFSEGWRLTLEGKIILSVGVCKHATDHGAEALGQDVADRLDELHKRKIDLADSVRILNVGGYIGSSTRSELEYARKLGKPVTFLEPEKE